MSAAASTRCPLSARHERRRLAATLRVTQARVVLSEWTKLRSLRSTRWSLFAAVLFTVGLPASSRSSRVALAQMRPRERADRHPLDIALAGSAHPARDRRSRRARDHRRVLDRDDPLDDRAVPDGSRSCGRRSPRSPSVTFVLMLPSVLDRLLRQSGDPRPPSHPSDLLLRPGCRTRVIGPRSSSRSRGSSHSRWEQSRATPPRGSRASSRSSSSSHRCSSSPLELDDAISPYLPNNAGSDIFALSPGSGNVRPGPDLRSLWATPRSRSRSRRRSCFAATPERRATRSSAGTRAPFPRLRGAARTARNPRGDVRVCQARVWSTCSRSCS